MSFCPEDQLLCAASAVQPMDSAKRAVTRVLGGALDWNYVLDSAVKHGVAPLLWHGLINLGVAEKIPSQVSAELRALYACNDARNRRLYLVLGDIVHAFSDSGVQVLALKELQLAPVVYGNLALRPIGDVDLLIRKEQYHLAASCMRRLGFAPAPAAHIPYTLKYAWAHHFRRAADNVWVDVQWNVLQMEWDVYAEGNFDFQIDRVWRHAERLSIGSYEILVPRPEDMLFHLCMHLEGHRYCELILLCDIAELIRHYAVSFDWDYLLRLTRGYGVASSLYYALLLAKELVHAQVPDSIFRKVTPSYFKANLFAPLYDNLASIHESLDDLAYSAAAPAPLMAEFETQARRQAALARHLYREIDGFASASTKRGAELVLFDGCRSDRIYPDDSLPAFQPFDCFVLKQHVPVVTQALKECGFERSSSDTQYTKIIRVQSRDPLLASAPRSLTITVDLETDLHRYFRSPVGREPSRAAVARRVITSKLRKRRGSGDAAFIRVYTFAPEEFLVAIAVRFHPRRDVLFGICSLLEFFRTMTGQIDWDTVYAVARRFGVQRKVDQTLAIVRQFSNVRASVRRPDRVELGYRVLQSARYSVEQNGRYATFKRGFLIAFSILCLRGFTGKFKYAARMVCRELAGGYRFHDLWNLFSRICSRRGASRAFAYWTEVPAFVAPTPGAAPAASPANIKATVPNLDTTSGAHEPGQPAAKHKHGNQHQ